MAGRPGPQGPGPRPWLGHAHRMASPPSSVHSHPWREGDSDEQGDAPYPVPPPGASWCSLRRYVGEDLAAMLILAARPSQVEYLAGGGLHFPTVGSRGDTDRGHHDEQDGDGQEEDHLGAFRSARGSGAGVDVGATRSSTGRGELGRASQGGRDSCSGDDRDGPVAARPPGFFAVVRGRGAGWHVSQGHRPTSGPVLDLLKAPSSCSRPAGGVWRHRSRDPAVRRCRPDPPAGSR